MWAGHTLKAGALMVMALSMAFASHAAPGIDREAWRGDLAVLKQTLQDDYAHLAWVASTQSGVDLPALEHDAQQAIATAGSDAQAEQALRTFLAGFHDGHLKLLDRQATGASAPTPAAVDPRTLDASTGCAALGVLDEGRHDYSVPLQALPGYHATAGGADPALRSGVIALADGRRLGLLRLHEFDALRYPGLCHRLWGQLRHADAVNDMRATLNDAWVAEIAATLRRFQQQGVDAVLVDVGTNPGGDDSGDTLARLFSNAPVQSAPLWVSQSAAGRDYLQEQYERIDDALRHHHPDATARPLLVQQRDRFAASLRATQAPPCDMTWVWQAPRDWPALPCRQLVAAGSSGGPLATPAVDAISDFLIAHRLDWAQDLRRHWAAWQGPVYVLTDAKTASSAEMFAARLQDNRIARVVGSTTGGYGCGFMSPPPPRTLPHSQLRMRIPNCVRLRADGSDEVAGISPDLPIDMPANAPARARAQRVLDEVGADLARH